MTKVIKEKINGNGVVSLCQETGRWSLNITNQSETNQLMFQTFQGTVYSLTYLTKALDEDGWYTNTTEYFHINDLEIAENAFNLRAASENPFEPTKLSTTFEEIAMRGEDCHHCGGKTTKMFLNNDICTNYCKTCNPEDFGLQTT